MANLDYTIASGIKPIQLESPINQLAQVYQLKGMQEASQMNALKMQEAQREAQQRNALSRLNPSSPTYFEDIQRISPELGYKYKKLASEAEAAGTTQQEAKVKLFNTKLAQSRQFLEGIDPNSPTAVQEFLKWHEANHADPVLGAALAERGITKDTARAHIEQALKSGRLADLIDESKLGIEKFAQFAPGFKKAAEDQLSQDYSDYLAAGGNLTRSQFKETRNRQPAAGGATTMPAVTNAAPVTTAIAPNQAAALLTGQNMAAAPVDVNAPVTAAPVSRIDANNTALTAAPRQGIDTINYGTYAPADVAAPAIAAAPAPVVAPAAVVVPAPGKKLELPGIHPEAAKLYSTRLPEDKIKADTIQRVYELSLKSENKQSEIAQLQADKAKAIDRGDTKAAKELQVQINKRNRIDENTPAVNPADLALVYKAINDGRLDPSKVNSRNISIIAGTLAMDPNANLKEMAIDSASSMAASKSLAVISANVLSASNEADNMIRIIRKYNPLVSRGQYPDLNAIQVAVDKKTGGTDIVALNTAINGAVNAYARAINPKGVATVSDKNHAREILNSAYSKGQLDTILNVMQEEMAAAKRSPGEASQILKALRRPQSSGGAAAAPPAGFKLD